MNVFKIKPSIQPYAWGGLSYIAAWLGKSNPEQRPMAEAWFGDHPLAPAFIEESNQPLSSWIAKDPLQALGAESIELYGSKMPFLLKILDVREMLSIQLHPSKEGAEKGYEMENAAGIPSDAPHRNYKDNNHKPEILFALSDFWMLQGFEELEKIENRFQLLIPENEIDFSGGWRSVLQFIWSLENKKAHKYITSISQYIHLFDTKDKNQIYHWLYKALTTYSLQESKPDKGLLVMLMLHVKYLKAGQVGYQAPGVLHAYLEGQNVELMANSDNVLRGGLTPKHIDVNELMKHVNFDLKGQCSVTALYLMEDEAAFNLPVKDFFLKHFLLKSGAKKYIQQTTIAILLLKSGQVRYGHQILKKGESLCIPAFTQFELECISENAEFFLAMAAL
ncbi:MAG: mannose-6-phosphate isomerase, class I [Saprospiraceae bacterium]